MSLRDKIEGVLRDVDPETRQRIAGELADLYARQALGEDVDAELRHVAAEVHNLGAARLILLQHAIQVWALEQTKAFLVGLAMA
jgi:hypothetical protein